MKKKEKLKKVTKLTLNKGTESIFGGSFGGFNTDATRNCGLEKFGSSQNGPICICQTTLINCDATDLGCHTNRNCPDSAAVCPTSDCYA